MNTQQVEEISVFRKFAEVCPLRLSLESTKNLDPGILCDLANGEKLTVKLVSVEDVAEPTFYAHAGNSIADRVSGELAKHPTHLLAWSHTASAAEPGHWRRDLQALSRSCPLTRIWVYSLGERAIVFDSLAG